MAKNDNVTWIKVPGGAVPDWFDGKDRPNAFERFERCRQIFLEGYEHVESQWTKSRRVFINTGRTKIPRVSNAFKTAANQIYHLVYDAIDTATKVIIPFPSSSQVDDRPGSVQAAIA